MKTKFKSNYAKGTIGYKADRLAFDLTKSCAGFSVLEFALKVATGADQVRLLNKDGQTIYMTDSAKYKETLAVERAALSRSGIVFYNDTASVAYKYCDNGTRVLAIRFAPGMNSTQMAESLERDKPTAKDWQPYDSSTNTFI